MEYKKLNQTILAFVLILSLLLICVILKALFFGNNNFEWGSFTDWISSLSTLGTLGVAYAAYRKAPEWMYQKHYDMVSKVIEEAIYEDLRKLSSLSNQYKSLIVHTCMTLKTCLNKHEELPHHMTDTLDKVENLLIEFFNLSYSIQNRLKAIPRYSYIITPYAKNIIDNIKHTADSYNYLQIQFEQASSEVPMHMYADEEALRITTKEISDIQLEAIELNNSLKDFVKSIYDDNKPINEFINVIK
ncbi:hypothetical protein ABK836_16385 [Enterobacter hormaechei]|nr:hypothetical protein [Enterobacter hormaechei]QLU71425.1 hypothetical protein HV217_08725 [Enterobacter cloacae]QLU91552.1 hypothetical protein HV266_08310 [Enterobacter roggenkampii]DAF10910.1 MAG TPA: hypothetical protein [Caudoviricetes sp.]HED3660524.1 hypothetical protein [Enterobacter hormaechei subsp. hoffmannii]QLN58188.1 hypothetical protein HV067_08085 [Enterobacter hormaechei]